MNRSCFLAGLLCLGFDQAEAGIYELQPAAGADQNLARMANALQPGDELILHPGVYTPAGRLSVTAKGTPERPITIRAALPRAALLRRSVDERDRYNNIEFTDCAYLVIRGLRFEGGNSGVRFIRGHHVAFEGCEIFETGNNALTMNSGDCHAFIVRSNHLHHTGLSTTHPTEGEGMYIGGHDGKCRTTDSLFEGNYIHHTRGTSEGGNDGIEIKFGSHGNVVRNNVIHDTNIGRQYPGIFVYGGGPGTNLVEGNVIWHAGEGIQVVADAVVRNNLVFDCAISGITAAPHVAVPQVRNAIIIHNTIYNTPVGVRLDWSGATNMVFANNAVYCAQGLAILATGLGGVCLRNNAVHGRLAGISLDGRHCFDGGTPAAAFIDESRHDFRPRLGSALLDRADTTFAPALDFDAVPRGAPMDVGAYEADGTSANPGWKIQPGFKNEQPSKDSQ